MPAPRRYRALPRVVAAFAIAGVAAGCGHLPGRPTATASQAAPPAPAAPAPAPSPGHWYWPFHRRAAAPPQPVEELVIQAAPGSTADFPQFWEGNTLVVDMRSASGSGAAVLIPREHTLWPVRVAFRVAPGSIGQLEVRGVQRTVFPVATSGTTPVDLELGPGAYAPRTPALTVSWGVAAIPAAP